MVDKSFISYSSLFFKIKTFAKDMCFPLKKTRNLSLIVRQQNRGPSKNKIRHHEQNENFESAHLCTLWDLYPKMRKN